MTLMRVQDVRTPKGASEPESNCPFSHFTYPHSDAAKLAANETAAQFVGCGWRVKAAGRDGSQVLTHPDGHTLTIQVGETATAAILKEKEAATKAAKKAPKKAKKKAPAKKK